MAYRQFTCKPCGAEIQFAPGTAALKCAHCGHEEPIPQSDAEIEELDFDGWLKEAAAGAEHEERLTVKCAHCGADATPPAGTTAGKCPFCGSPLVAEGGSSRVIKPKSVLPFKVTQDQARRDFRAWVRGLWFAPNALKRFAQMQAGLSGMYIPYWTYDCRTLSRYTGERGDDYYTTQTYTAIVNGRPVTRTRQVKRTRWTSVSGVVGLTFDDILIRASRSLPEKHLDRLEPWDLANLVPYNDDYLSGFRAESYQMDLAEGFGEAKGVMDAEIREAVRRDIGGDHQRIHSVATRHDNVTFKHLLLPVWISAYRFRDRTYRFLINGRTGEVQGERPWSWVKIALAILIPIAAAAIMALATAR